MSTIANRSQSLRKARSRARILEAAAGRLRAKGLAGTTVGEVMADAGMTHGGFYAHFDDAGAMRRAALRQAAGSARQAWLGRREGAGGEDWLRWLAGRYLTAEHRDRPETGCPFAALAADAGRADSALRRALEEELMQTIEALEARLDDAGSPAQAHGQALALLSLCAGAMALARAVDSPALAEEILRAGRLGAARLAAHMEPRRKAG